MSTRLDELAKKYRAREKYRQQTQGHSYVNITYEFKSRKSAREFLQEVWRLGVYKYAPFFCDEFKYAQVTVFEPLETGKEQEDEKDTG